MRLVLLEQVYRAFR
ncbi:hypothetical protein ACT4US_27615, partial [Bacillus sp. HC-Mk]